jgi:hypothetical protein
MALHALERGETVLRWEAIAAIKKALEQPEQDPVAHICRKEKNANHAPFCRNWWRLAC